MTTEHDPEHAGQTLLHLDHKVHEAVKASRFSAGVKVISKLSDVGDQPQLRLLCAGMIVAGIVRKDGRMVIAGTRMLLAHEVATVAKTAIKDRIDRTRPRSAGDEQQEKPQAGHDKGKEESSFPSGHSAGAMAVSSAYAAVYPARTVPALLVAGAVGAAQIPRCAHYPTDVGAGLALGAAANGVVGLLWRALKATGAVIASRYR
jgi:membrane-associated phospholipid phosphatase